MNLKNLVPSSWRDILARLPLPMLALAASYGVYSFALMFVPAWVAIVQAAAFELVYIGLAVVRLDDKQQKRAQAISVGAVVVSMAYNSLDGLFHRRPELLTLPPLWLDVALSLLHGIPLAALAYLVADLLLHSVPAHTQKGIESAKALTSSEPLAGGRPGEFVIADVLSIANQGIVTRQAVIDKLACSDATASRLLREGMQAGKLSRSSPGVYNVVS